MTAEVWGQKQLTRKQEVRELEPLHTTKLKSLAAKLLNRLNSTPSNLEKSTQAC